MRPIMAALLAFLAIVVAGPSAAQAEGRLGVQVRALTQEEADRFGWEAPRGAYVVATESGSAETPAQRGGLTGR